MGLASELRSKLQNTATRYTLYPNLAAGVTLTSGGVWAYGAAGVFASAAALGGPGSVWYICGIHAYTATLAEAHQVAAYSAATLIAEAPFDTAAFSEGQYFGFPYPVQGGANEACNGKSASVTGGGTILAKALIATGM